MPSTYTGLKPHTTMNKWTDRDENTLIRLFNTGMSYADMARRMARGEAALKKRIHQLGLTRQKFTDECVNYPKRSKELNSAIIYLQRLGDHVFNAAVTGGPTYKYIFNRKEVPPSFLIEQAIKQGWTNDV